MHWFVAVLIYMFFYYIKIGLGNKSWKRDQFYANNDKLLYLIDLTIGHTAEVNVTKACQSAGFGLHLSVMR